MGYYIQVPQPFNKASQLEEIHGAERISRPDSLSDVADDKAVVCVVQNGLFDAAGLVYNDRELQEFGDPRDDRSKTWLTMDKALAHELSGYGPR